MHHIPKHANTCTTYIDNVIDPFDRLFSWGQAIAAEITDFSSEKRQLFEGNKPVRSQLLGHISAYLELSQPNHNKKSQIS